MLLWQTAAVLWCLQVPGLGMPDHAAKPAHHVQHHQHGLQHAPSFDPFGAADRAGGHGRADHFGLDSTFPDSPMKFMPGMVFEVPMAMQDDDMQAGPEPPAAAAGAAYTMEAATATQMMQQNGWGGIGRQQQQQQQQQQYGAGAADAVGTSYGPRPGAAEAQMRQAYPPSLQMMTKEEKQRLYRVSSSSAPWCSAVGACGVCAWPMRVLQSCHPSGYPLLLSMSIQLANTQPLWCALQCIGMA
jgi:hypothetical protein